MNSEQKDKDEFERIMESIDIAVPDEYQEKMNTLEQEEETGIIDSKKHALVVVMDYDEESSIQTWRFISKFDKDSTRRMLAKFVQDWEDKEG